MALANETPIAVPSGEKQISAFVIGDEVLVGVLAPDITKLAAQWVAAKIGFSEGTPDRGGDLMVFIKFIDHDKKMVCTRGTVVLLAAGRLTTVEKLRPGQLLLGFNNQAVKIEFIEIGLYYDGVRNIASNWPQKFSADGHLLLANGVVIGDYILETNFHQLSSTLKQEGHDALPNVGTPEYELNIQQ